MGVLKGGSTVGGLPIVTRKAKTGAIPRVEGNSLVNSLLEDDGVDVISTGGIKAPSFTEGGTLLNAKYLGIGANAVSASKWSVARTITMNGDVTGSVSMDGSANVTLTVAVVDDSHSHSDYAPLVRKAQTYGTSGIIGKLGSSLAIIAGEGRTLNDARYQNDDEDLFLAGGRDVVIESNADNTDSPPTIRFTSTGVLTLNGNQVWHAGTFNPATKLDASANAVSASKLATARTISLAGDVTGSVSFDGTGDVSITTTYKNSGVSAGTYTKVTTDVKGNITGGTTLSATDIPALDWSKITTGKPTTLAGYGITDALNLSGGTLTGGLVFTATATSGVSASSPTALSYGKLQSYGNLLILGNTDNSVTDEYVLIASGQGITPTTANGLKIGTNELSWKGSAVWHAGNDGVGSGLDADFLDGNDGSYYDHRVYNSQANYLGGGYIGGGQEKPNWFGAGKLKLQMLSGGNIGAGDTWNDVLWMSAYTGGDVKGSTAMFFGKTSDTVGFIRQNYDSATWGTPRILWHNGNFNPATKLDASANAVSATKLETARTISLTGGVTGSASFDGTANISISATVVSHTHTIANITSLQTELDNKLNLAGGTMTGFVTLHANPTSNMHSATKQYVDTAVSNVDVSSQLATKADLAGATFTGAVRSPVGLVIPVGTDKYVTA